MQEKQEKIEAYHEILTAVEKHQEFLQDDEFKNLRNYVRAMEISLRFGIPVAVSIHTSALTSISVKGAYDAWTRIALFSEGSIAWPDDDRQPQDEWLYRICFTSGAYIFGDCYPVETFKAFWEELKTFEPKYVDTVNSSMYFTEDKSQAVHEAFWGIYRKYSAMVKAESERQRIAELEKELAKLKEKN